MITEKDNDDNEGCGGIGGTGTGGNGGIAWVIFLDMFFVGLQKWDTWS